MKKTALVSLSALAVLTLVATVALAGPGYGRNMGQGLQAQGWQQLTPEQQEKAAALFDAHQEKVQPIRDQLYAKRMTLEAMVNAGNADEPAITKLVSEISDLHQQLRDQRDAFRQELSDATGVDFGGWGGGWGNGYAPCGGQGFHGKGYGPCGGGSGPCGY